MLWTWHFCLTLSETLCTAARVKSCFTGWSKLCFFSLSSVYLISISQHPNTRTPCTCRRSWCPWSSGGTGGSCCPTLGSTPSSVQPNARTLFEIKTVVFFNSFFLSVGKILFTNQEQKSVHNPAHTIWGRRWEFISKIVCALVSWFVRIIYQCFYNI